MTIEIINISKENQKFQFEYDFLCDRRTPVGNPEWETVYEYPSQAWRDEVCDRYEIYFHTMIEHNNPEFIAYIGRMIHKYKLYKTLRLFCWCAPKRCHVETIRNYILKETEEKW